MRLTRRLATVAGGLLVLALTAAPGAAPEQAREQIAPPPGPPPKVFAFVSGLGGAELARLERVGVRIDVAAPNWYALNTATGHLRGPSRPGPLRAAAQRAGVAVWPTVNARTGRSRRWESPHARARIVRSISVAARATGATGVTLDMEELRPDQRASFTALVGEAAARVHAAGRQLAVYVPRPGPGSGAAYDWAALASVADLLLCSGYNEHFPAGPPGPTTTSAGFLSVVDSALQLAGPDKAVPVLGAFGYRWSPRRRHAELVSSAGAQRLRRRHRATAVRSDGSERFHVGHDTVVYETAAGLRARAAAASAAGTRWIGLFSLGREPLAFWPGLATARASKASPREAPPARGASHDARTSLQ